MAHDRLPNLRNSISPHDQVKIDAADDDNWLLHEDSISITSPWGAIAINPGPNRKKTNMAGMSLREAGGGWQILSR